jgi:hypothetical protein
MISRSFLSVRFRSLLVLACVSLLANAAMGADKCGSLDRVTLALRLTRVLYPEFQGREFSVAFGVGYPGGGPLSFPTDARSLGITLDQPQWRPPETNGGSPDTTPQLPPTPEGDLELPLHP